MKDAYIVKKSVLRNPIRPDATIRHEEYINLVNENANLI